MSLSTRFCDKIAAPDLVVAAPKLAKHAQSVDSRESDDEEKAPEADQQRQA